MTLIFNLGPYFVFWAFGFAHLLQIFIINEYNFAQMSVFNVHFQLKSIILLDYEKL